MEVCRRSSWLLLLLGVSLLATTLQGVQGEVESEGPSESECRPYIEKALKELETGESGTIGTVETGDSKEDVPTVEVTNDDSDHPNGEGDDDTHEEGTESIESVEADQNVPEEQESEQEDNQEKSAEGTETEQDVKDTDTTQEDIGASQEQSVTSEEGEEQKTEDAESKENTKETEDEDTAEDKEGQESVEEAQSDTDDEATKEDNTQEADDTKEETDDSDDTKENVQSAEEGKAEAQILEQQETTSDTQEETEEEAAESQQKESVEEAESIEQLGSVEAAPEETKEETQSETQEDDNDTKENETKEEQDDAKEQDESADDTKSSEQKDTKSDTQEDKTVEEQERSSAETQTSGGTNEASTEQDDSTPDDAKPEESQEDKTAEAPEKESTESTKETDESIAEDELAQDSEARDSKESAAEGKSEAQSEEDGSGESAPEEELSLDIEIPSELRDRTHVEHLLKLDEEASETENIINRVAEITLKELKKLYENAIKPLEVLYKYRDLSNRHFGDAEIFSKPLILFMGPWSGGKSSIINYLLDNEYNETSLRTGAEPSPAYFNIMMYGEEPEILDGTQLAADYTFSGLQKFGQGLEERLRGVKLPNKLLDKVNVVEIPGILEVRKQVSRVFPFNDACQWFIDRADIIFLVYDPSKLDVGPETEAILDQLKGREHQTRIILNKADQVKPEELMRVQGALIWNISPLMSSAQPPIMYTTSLWSRPFETWAPSRLLQAQERAFLRDLRSAIDKRIENKIASARRFAVRVRNHAKMVDCYLTTYYNHKSVFGNRKQVADQIIEHPQDYHIYEGLSTLTNISRYDLPDPDVYKDFFKLNPLYDFQQLSATCTYFRGCPINRLDVAIAYDLPELVGKHKRLVESALAEANQTPVPGS